MDRDCDKLRRRIGLLAGIDGLIDRGLFFRGGHGGDGLLGGRVLNPTEVVG